jgi:uncharacterized membrane protein (DUF485 family)
MSTKTIHELLEDPEFKTLARQKDTISMVLTILELIVYFGFIALVAYNKAFLARKIADGSAITIGIPIAVGAIVISWLLTGVYIYWANTKYDAMVKNVKDRLRR